MGLLWLMSRSWKIAFRLTLLKWNGNGNAIEDEHDPGEREIEKLSVVVSAF